MHARLDYPLALALLVVPAMLGLSAAAVGLSAAAGLGALALTLATQHEAGVWRMVPYAAHLALDAVVGLIFVAAPLIFMLAGAEAAYFIVMGLAILLLVAAHRADAPA